MTITTDASFGIDDLNSQRSIDGCPIKGCTESPTRLSKLLICPKHGLEIHKSTYVYYNGDNAEEKKKARLRNLLPFGRMFIAKQIFNNPHKAESHRFGSENSEDALTWNIFGGLLYYGRLHYVYNLITGESSSPDQLELFLWGLKIDFKYDQRPETWSPLMTVRKELERDIKHFKTEPDIMILGPTCLVCIEAKFTSGNPIAISKEVAVGEKPKSREGVIKRYIRPIKLDDKLYPPVIQPEHLGEKVHSQLLRMLVFTGAMAQIESRNWIVANLVSKTQWNKRGNKSKGYDFDDPTPSIPDSVKNNFKLMSWEDDIYKKVLKHDSALVELSDYMKKKTANFKKAFDLDDLG